MRFRQNLELETVVTVQAGMMGFAKNMRQQVGSTTNIPRMSAMVLKQLDLHIGVEYWFLRHLA
jgi:hypothetical protein